MAAPGDRANAALLVIDMQRDVVGEAYNVDAVLDNINTLVERARAEGIPVVWIQHSDEGMPKGSEGWEYVPELDWSPNEPLIHKEYGDSFEDTDLEQVLADLDVGRVFVTGAQTDQCIRSTLHGAFVRGYDTTLVEDAHTTEDLRQWGAPVAPEDAIAYTNMYWSWAKAPGRKGGTVATAQVDFTL